MDMVVVTGEDDHGFRRVFEKQNHSVEKAIRSLDNLNEQIMQFVLTPLGHGRDLEDGELSPRDREKLKTSMALMRKLLMEAQTKFKKMVEDNKKLASRIDSSILAANQQVSALKAELADTSVRLNELGTKTAQTMNQRHLVAATKDLHWANDQNCDQYLREELSHLQEENCRLQEEIIAMEKQLRQCSHDNSIEKVAVVTAVTDDAKASSMNFDLMETKRDLERAKEGLQAMKADRRRLKTEKLELLNQMKQLYCTLEDKESELRDFIRNYEKHMREAHNAVNQMRSERDEAESERWTAIQQCQETSAQLQHDAEAKDMLVKRLEAELRKVMGSRCNSLLSSLYEDLHLSTLQSNASSGSADSGVKGHSPRPVTYERRSPRPSGFIGFTAVEEEVVAVNAHAVRAGREVQMAGKKQSDTSIMSVSSGYIGSLENCTQSSDSTTTSSHYPVPRPSPSPRPYQPPAAHHSSKDSISTSDAGSVVMRDRSNTPGRVNMSADRSSTPGRISSSLESSQSSTGTPLGLARPPGYNHYGDFVIHSDIQLKRNKKRSKSPNTFSKLFNKSRTRKSVAITDAKVIEEVESGRLSLLNPENYQEKMAILDTTRSQDMEAWKASQVLAWLEIELNMPMYARHCAENIKSGKVLLGLSDAELDSALDLKSPLHRRKLRLAIEEYRDPGAIRYVHIGQLDHTYAAHRWSVDIGLPQYSNELERHLVDGRLLSVLTRRDLEKYLGVSKKFHQVSIIHGVDLLHRVGFDKEILSERRAGNGGDLMVWTNARVIRWLEDIDLQEYVVNLAESGLHGAVLVLEPTFTAESLAALMGIPQNKAYVRRHLATEFDGLVRPARAALDTHHNGKKRNPHTGSLGTESGRAFVRSFRGGASSQDEGGSGVVRKLSFRGSLGRMFGSNKPKEVTHAQEEEISRSFDSSVPPTPVRESKRTSPTPARGSKKTSPAPTRVSKRMSQDSTASQSEAAMQSHDQSCDAVQQSCNSSMEASQISESDSKKANLKATRV